MVQDPNAEQVSHRDQARRQQAVFLTRLRVPARMVVHKNHGGCRFPHGQREHLPGVHDAERQTPLGDDGVPENGVFGVQQHDLEDLVTEVPIAGRVMVEEIGARADPHPGRQWTGENAPAQFNAGFELGGLGWPHPGNPAKIRDPSV
jgi:hypothetical protein